MIFLSLAVAVFVAVHLVPAMPKTKAAIRSRLGKAYGPAFGTAATITFFAIVFAWGQTSFEPVYEPPSWGRHANLTLTFFAMVFLAIFFFKGSLHKLVRFPFAIADIFWASGHLMANGDQTSLILFGGLLAFGIIYIALALKADIYPEFEVVKNHNVISIIVGVLFYTAMAFAHPYLIGMQVIFLD